MPRATLVDPPDNKASGTGGVQFESTYRPVAGTLPRLRYGRTYTFRARPVDISGVSRPVSGATHPASAESPPAPFGRGPVPAPAVVRRANKDPLPGVGEFVATIVLLSDYNTPLNNIPSQSRMLLPPTSSQSRLELSALPNGGIKPSDYSTLAQRDALKIEDECDIDPESGDLVYQQIGRLGIENGRLLAGPRRRRSCFQGVAVNRGDLLDEVRGDLAQQTLCPGCS